MTAYAVFFRISVPDTPQQWLFFLSALFLAWWVSFSWRFLINLAAFWTPDAVGIGRLVFTLSWFTSGFLMPLRLFPDWFQRLCSLTPFPHTINTVVEIYLGVDDHRPGQAALRRRLIRAERPLRREARAGGGPG